MKFFHGSQLQLATLKTSNQTGNIRKGEEDRKDLRDVIFMTTSQHEARNYAGNQGYVYVLDAKNSIQLSSIPAQGKEGKKRSVSIWIAHPEDIKIIMVICHDGKIKKPFKDRILIG